jgi:hypothetical protein
VTARVGLRVLSQVRAYAQGVVRVPVDP